MFVDVSVKTKTVTFFLPLAGATVKLATGAIQGAGVGVGLAVGAGVGVGPGGGVGVGVGVGVGEGDGVGVDAAPTTGVMAIVADAVWARVMFWPPVNVPMSGVIREK
jgi:hypothetical protein